MLDQIKKLLTENKGSSIFVAKLIFLYLLLQGLYDYVLSPYTNVDHWLIDGIITSAENILQLLGYELLTPNGIYPNHMGIEGTSGVVIGNPCDGLSLFILYAAFVIVFKGKWWAKLLFIIPGILLIHFLNVIRVVSLALIVKYYPETLDFHHSYTFTLIVYAFTFLLWVVRIKTYKKYKV